MEDKIIIKSERYNVKKIFKYGLILSIVAAICSFLFWFMPVMMDRLTYYSNTVENIEKYEKEGSFQEDDGLWYDVYDYNVDKKFVEGCGSALGYVRYEIGIFFIILIITFVCPQVPAVIIYSWLKSYELTITDKRAYGFTAFGRRVDLPVDSITAISLSWLKSIAITTASGKISFKLIKNRDEMYETISKLIIERQNKKVKEETFLKQEIPQSNADELRKYKDLLDSGVITQEEFEHKKNQLLGF